MSDNLKYTPEDPAKELFELVGRLKAFAAYVNHTKFSIEKEICASMLGFKLKEKAEIIKWISKKMDNFDLEFTGKKEALVTDENGNVMLLRYDSNTKQVYEV